MNQIQPTQGNFSSSPMQRIQELTTEQEEMVSSILAQYSPDTLTETEAEEIRQAFREANISPSQSLHDAIEKAGFDAKTMRGSEGQRPDGPPPPPPSSSTSETGSLDSLDLIKEILDQYDLSNLEEDEMASLFEELQQTGLFASGAFINTIT